jgi:hypothetical protein
VVSAADAEGHAVAVVGAVDVVPAKVAAERAGAHDVPASPRHSRQSRPDGTKHNLLCLSLFPVAACCHACDHVAHDLLDVGQTEFFLAEQRQLAAVL